MKGYLIFLILLIGLSTTAALIALLLIAPPPRTIGSPFIEIENMVYNTKVIAAYGRTGNTIEFQAGETIKSKDLAVAAKPGKVKFCVKASDPECPKDYIFSSDLFEYNTAEESIKAKHKVSGTPWAYRPAKPEVEVWIGFRPA